jgi:hypothetical protein
VSTFDLVLLVVAFVAALVLLALAFGPDPDLEAPWQPDGRSLPERRR